MSSAAPVIFEAAQSRFAAMRRSLEAVTDIDRAAANPPSSVAPPRANPADFVLEWSHSQRCFHIEQIGDMTSRNLQALVENRASDYIAIAVGLTHVQAHAVAREIGARTHLESMQAMEEKWSRVGL